VETLKNEIDTANDKARAAELKQLEAEAKIKKLEDEVKLAEQLRQEKFIADLQQQIKTLQSAQTLQSMQFQQLSSKDSTSSRSYRSDDTRRRSVADSISSPNQSSDGSIDNRKSLRVRHKDYLPVHKGSPVSPPYKKISRITDFGIREFRKKQALYEDQLNRVSMDRGIAAYQHPFAEYFLPQQSAQHQIPAAALTLQPSLIPAQRRFETAGFGSVAVPQGEASSSAGSSSSTGSY
jgi:hypothetical protein